MLVLTRRRKETIRIGNHITITVVDTGRDTKLGIEAPKDVRILRGELDDRTGAYKPDDSRDAPAEGPQHPAPDSAA